MDPNTAARAIDELERRLDQHVGFLRERALACPPGGARPWDEALAHYGVAADPAHVRFQSARDSGQRAGATVEEFLRALEALSRFALDEVSRGFSPQDRAALQPALAHRVAMLEAKARSTPAVERERYAHDVGAGTHKSVGASVSSVFANAQSTAKLTPWADAKVNPATIMSCHTCGAPQERPLDFKCRYCRSAIYEKR